MIPFQGLNFLDFEINSLLLLYKIIILSFSPNELFAVSKLVRLRFIGRKVDKFAFLLQVCPVLAFIQKNNKTVYSVKTGYVPSLLI